MKSNVDVLATDSMRGTTAPGAILEQSCQGTGARFRFFTLFLTLAHADNRLLSESCLTIATMIYEKFGYEGFVNPCAIVRE